MKANNSPEPKHGSIHSYVIGYVLSLALTAAAFSVVKKHIDSGHLFPSDGMVLAILAVLAITQLFVQLVFFLHLDRESKPRWNAAVLGLAVVVVFILVAGSIWIIGNLNYHHPGQAGSHSHGLNPAQTDQTIIKDEGIK